MVFGQRLGSMMVVFSNLNDFVILVYSSQWFCELQRFKQLQISIARLQVSLFKPALRMLLKLPLLETWTIFQNLKGIKLICFLFAVVSKAIVHLKSYLEVLLLLEIICSFQDERIIVDLPESLWRTVLSRVQLRKKSTNSQNLALRVKKHPYFLSQTMFAWYLNFSGLIQTGLWCASASFLFFLFVWKNKVYSRKKNEKIRSLAQLYYI